MFYRDPHNYNVNPALIQPGDNSKKKSDKKLEYYLKPFSYFPLPKKYGFYERSIAGIIVSFAALITIIILLALIPVYMDKSKTTDVFSVDIPDVLLKTNKEISEILEKQASERTMEEQHTLDEFKKSVIDELNKKRFKLPDGISKISDIKLESFGSAKNGLISVGLILLTRPMTRAQRFILENNMNKMAPSEFTENSEMSASSQSSEPDLPDVEMPFRTASSLDNGYVSSKAAYRKPSVRYNSEEYRYKDQEKSKEYRKKKNPKNRKKGKKNSAATYHKNPMYKNEDRKQSYHSPEKPHHPYHNQHHNQHHNEYHGQHHQPHRYPNNYHHHPPPPPPPPHHPHNLYPPLPPIHLPNFNDIIPPLLNNIHVPPIPPLPHINIPYHKKKHHKDGSHEKKYGKGGSHEKNYGKKHSGEKNYGKGGSGEKKYGKKGSGEKEHSREIFELKKKENGKTESEATVQNTQNEVQTQQPQQSAILPIFANSNNKDKNTPKKKEEVADLVTDIGSDLFKFIGPKANTGASGKMKIPNMMLKNLNDVPSLMGLQNSKKVIEPMAATPSPTKSSKINIQNLVLKNLDEIDKLPSLIGVRVSTAAQKTVEPKSPANLFLEKVKEEKKKAEENKLTTVAEGTLGIFSQALDMTNTNIFSKKATKPKPAAKIEKATTTAETVLVKNQSMETEDSSVVAKTEQKSSKSIKKMKKKKKKGKGDILEKFPLDPVSINLAFEGMKNLFEKSKEKKIEVAQKTETTPASSTNPPIPSTTTTPPTTTTPTPTTTTTTITTTTTMTPSTTTTEAALVISLPPIIPVVIPTRIPFPITIPPFIPRKPASFIKGRGDEEEDDDSSPMIKMNKKELDVLLKLLRFSDNNRKPAPEPKAAPKQDDDDAKEFDDFDNDDTEVPTTTEPITTTTTTQKSTTVRAQRKKSRGKNNEKIAPPVPVTEKAPVKIEKLVEPPKRPIEPIKMPIETPKAIEPPKPDMNEQIMSMLKQLIERSNAQAAEIAEKLKKTAFPLSEPLSLPVSPVKTESDKKAKVTDSTATSTSQPVTMSTRKMKLKEEVVTKEQPNVIVIETTTKAASTTTEAPKESQINDSAAVNEDEGSSEKSTTETTTSQEDDQTSQEVTSEEQTDNKGKTEAATSATTGSEKQQEKTTNEKTSENDSKSEPEVTSSEIEESKESSTQQPDGKSEN